MKNADVSLEMENGKPMSKGSAGFTLILVTVLWGVSYPLMHMVVISGISPNFMVLIRGFIHLVSCLFFFRKSIAVMSIKAWKTGLLIAFFFFGGNLFQSMGILYTTPSRNAFISVTYVVITPFITRLFFREKLPKKVLFSVPCSIFGMAILTDVLNNPGAFNRGDLYTLICAFFYAAMLAWIFHKQGDITYKALSFCMALVQTVGAFFIIAVTQDGGYRSSNMPATLIILLFLGFFGSFLGSSAQVKAQKYVSATSAALLLAMEGVFSGVFSVLFGIERFSTSLIFGGLLIVLAVIVMEVTIDC